MNAPSRQLAIEYRCTCHHPGRRCKYQCSNSTEVVRPSDGRPVCGSCVRCNPEHSAGFRIDEHHWAEPNPATAAQPAPVPLDSRRTT